MILLAGGTGRLGRLVVARLVARGEPVRVLTREPARADLPSGPLVEVVQGDVRVPATLPSALAGVGVVVSAVHGFAGPGRVTPESVDRDGNANLVAAARAAGADVVLVSVVGASPDHAMELFRMKAAAESNLRASGVRWTVVRASAFLELYLELLHHSAGKSGRPMVFGRGDNPINFVTVPAVADTVVGAVLDPSVRGRVVEIVGPRDLTLNELAARCQRERGTTESGPRHLPRAALRMLAASRYVMASGLARQAHAALIMDSTDMTFGSHSDRIVQTATGPDGAVVSGQ